MFPFSSSTFLLVGVAIIVVERDLPWREDQQRYEC